MNNAVLLFVALTTSLLITNAANASTELEQEILHCKSLETTTERLRCYDNIEIKAVGPTALTVNAKTSTEAQEVPQQTTDEPSNNSTTSPDELFGQEKAQARIRLEELAGYKEADTLEARVTEVEKNSRGQFIVTLENGQIWHQFDSKRLRIKIGDMITIVKGRMGSYQLRKSKGTVTLRVRRVS